MKAGIISLLVFATIVGCKEKYNPPVTSPQTGYLVVEGFINSGTEPTTITLTRTTPLEQGTGTAYETNAQVTIEGDNGETYPLYQSNVGAYSSASLSLNAAANYRIHITTADGREYVSDYTPIKGTPPIDSLSWQRDNGDVQIYVNSHDPLNATRYYQWQYRETWEYHSAYQSVLTYERDPATQLVTALTYWYPSHETNLSIYKCWHDVSSTNILLGTTEKLTADVVHFPIEKIGQGSQLISVLYRIAVKQVALSSAKYQFLLRMRKNTETLGSIFDAQPSQLNTNIHCLSNPAEQVIGFVEVSQEQDQGLFISNSQLPGWKYSQPCELKNVINNVDTINATALGLYPTSVSDQQNLVIKAFYASTPSCVDCTLSGSNVKPDFWP